MVFFMVMCLPPYQDPRPIASRLHYISYLYHTHTPGPWPRCVDQLLTPHHLLPNSYHRLPCKGFLYSGLSRRKSALSLIYAVGAANAVTIFQWYFWGYSLAFSSTATNGFIGNLHNFGLQNVLGDPSPGSPLIPELLYSFFQMEFACVTICILMGGLAERGRILPAMVFSFAWVTLVYCPIGPSKLRSVSFGPLSLTSFVP